MSDQEIMSIAIQEARIAFANSNFPAGAVLVINKEIVGVSHNRNCELGTLYYHAENSLLVKYSSQIKKSAKNKDYIEVYSTLEPCLYCFAGLLQHNVNRIVYSISDPNVGSCRLLPHLSDWYQNKKIEIVSHILSDEYLPILFEFNQIRQEYDWNQLIAVNSHCKLR